MENKRILRIICVLTLILSLVVSTGCSAKTDTDTKMTTKYCSTAVSYNNAENSADDFSFTELIKEDAEYYELTESAKEMTANLEKELFDYLIETYELDWEFKNTKVCMLDFSTVSDGEYTYYAAMADPRYETVYVNALFVQKESDLAYRLAHEFIHCMRYYNIGTTQYVLKNAEGGYIGYYAGESYTDIIAANFLETLGEDAPLDYFLNGSGYCYTTVALQVIGYSIVESEKMYLENDMQGFYTALKELTQIHITDAENIDYAEKFLYYADLIMYATNDLMCVTTIEEYNNISKFFLNAIFGNFEIALSVSDNLEDSEEKEVFEIVKHLFELEGESEELTKHLEYLETCLE